MKRNFDSPDFKLLDSGHIIHVNQMGYNPYADKRAILPAGIHTVYLVNASGDYVWTGIPKEFGFDKASGDTVAEVDFSDFSTPGRYKLVCEKGDSLEFLIDPKENAYNKTFASIIKAFYYQRCGCELERKYAGRFWHNACHCGTSIVWDKPDSVIKVSGGWHDAGDYGRYVTAGCTALAHLLYAYKLYDYTFDEIEVDIPEKNQLGGAIIAEIRYELSWLIRMQRTDGAVFHKQTGKEHAMFIMPEKDKDQLYLFPVSTIATADFAATCALASSIFKRYDSSFSKYLEGAAVTAYHWLSNNPNFVEFKNPEGVTTGEYGERDDHDNRLWAAVELYNITGSKEYLNDIDYYLTDNMETTYLGYAKVGGLAALGWLCEHDEERSEITNRFRKNFMFRADELQKFCQSSGYGISLRDCDFHWGSNMFLLSNACLMAIAGHFNRTSKYDKDILHHLDYILGINPLGYSYVTGNGQFAAKDPHHRQAFDDGIDECIPGFIVGGPNSNPCEWQIKDRFAHIPPMKCYIDDVRFYSLNEITIYWNSPAVFLMAYLESKR